MRSFLILPTPILAGVLMLGCEDRPAPTEPASAPRPSLRTEQNPDGPGAIVLRIDDDRFFWVIIDFDRGLTALLGSNPEAHLQACQTGIPPEENDLLLIFRPDGSAKALVKDQAMGAMVWPVASGDICGELLAVPLLAVGTARVRYTDNDPFLSFSRANAYGVQAHGTVTALDTGEDLKLLARFQAVWFPNEEEPEVRSSEVRLQPD